MKKLENGGLPVHEITHLSIIKGVKHAAFTNNQHLEYTVLKIFVFGCENNLYRNQNVQINLNVRPHLWYNSYYSVIVFSYFYENERGLFPENQFVMDLELPEDFTPVNADGETESFQLVSVAQVWWGGFLVLIGAECWRWCCGLCRWFFCWKLVQMRAKII